MSASTESSQASGRCTDRASKVSCKLSVLITMLLIFGSARIALAHGEAEWIMAVEPRCCGPNDCAPVAEDGIKRINGGFLVRETGEVVSDRAALWSIDDHYWRCRYTSGARTGQTRCLFVPALGF
jgi:hypothetical protein